MKAVIKRARHHGEIFGIGRRNAIEALIIKFPAYNSDLNEITNINGYSKSFDFLKEEPDLYSASDLKKRYRQGYVGL